MIIPVVLKPPPDGGEKLPPQLADLGNGHLVLIELQGSLEVQGSTDAQFVGTLTFDPKTVCALPVIIVEPGMLTQVGDAFSFIRTSPRSL